MLSKNHSTEDDHRIGRIMIENGSIQRQDVDQILSYQSNNNCTFGRAVVALKLASQEDVEQALASQFSSAVVSHGGNEPSKDLITAIEPFGHQAEIFRALRSRLVLTSFERGSRGLAVVSPMAGSGCTYVTVNLAVSLAQLGVKVCLVDANLRDPRVGEIFDLPDETMGLTDLLTGRTVFEELDFQQLFPGLAVISAGRKPPNPQELLSGRAFVKFVSQILREFEVVLFDTPAANTCADGQTVAARLGTAIMVVRAHKTLAADVDTLAAQIRFDRGNLVGTVLNEF